jgi:hypothetical protein
MDLTRRISALLTAAAMAAVCIPAAPMAGVLPTAMLAVQAEDEAPTSGSCGENLTWTFDKSTGTLTISGTGEITDYVDALQILDELEHAKEQGLLPPWYDDCESITSIVIEDGVTHIGNGAFQSCYKATSLSIPGTVTSIGNWAFQLCTQVTSVTLPDSVTSIGDYAFSNVGRHSCIRDQLRRGRFLWLPQHDLCYAPGQYDAHQSAHVPGLLLSDRDHHSRNRDIYRSVGV